MDPLAQYAIVFLLTALVAYQIVVVRFAVARIERTVAHIAAFLKLDTSKPPPLSESVKELARQPDGKFTAIHAYRAETGAGLAEAQAVVEEYLASLDS